MGNRKYQVGQLFVAPDAWWTRGMIVQIVKESSKQMRGYVCRMVHHTKTTAQIWTVYPEFDFTTYELDSCKQIAEDELTIYQMQGE